MRGWPRRFFVVPLFAALSLVAGACGEEGAVAPPTVDGAGFPVTISAGNGQVTIDERPERIVSLSTVATEMLFAIDASDQVVAVDDQSNHPPQAPMTDLSGFEPNIEAIASYDPDVVVVSFDPGELVSSLETLGIAVIMHPAADSFDDTYDQVIQLGAATGRVAEAEHLVNGMREDIERLAASAPSFAEPPTYYHELEQSLFTVTSDTFIGQVYALAGLENIADAAGAGSQYPQLSAEFIVSADPDLIFLADVKCCGESAETVAARPGWDQVTAVREGGVVELDDDIASRWGPRVVDFLATVVEAVSELA